jgi:cysteinyl-tRNA synthetase
MQFREFREFCEFCEFCSILAALLFISAHNSENSVNSVNSDLYIYNTLTRKKEKFEPLNPPFVGMYVCGPTVYSDVHMGNCRTFISFDVMFRYLLHLGYKVRYVRNITDVGHLTDDADEGEDKIAKKARLEQLEPMEIVQRYTVGFREVMAIFNALPPSIEPSATGHLIEQIEMTQTILDNGFAYVSDGSVYFDVEKYAKSHPYGELSGRNLDELQEGTRDTLEGQDEKKGRLDFALWKKAKPEHIMRWNSPWGVGFPGWHIECSAMSRKYLGDQFDIHGGGMDLVPTHHTNEIAQNVGCCGTTPVRYWLHTNMLTVNGRKMSKSLGNSFLPVELFTGLEVASDSPSANPSEAKMGRQHPILDKGYSPMSVRFLMLQTHYSSTLDFSNEALQAGEKGFMRLMEAMKNLDRLTVSATSTVDVAALNAQAYAAMNDDFNTPILVATLFEAVRFVNLVKDGKETLDEASLEALKVLMKSFVHDVLGLKDDLSGSSDLAEGLMQVIIGLRAQVRQDKNWAMSDRIRDDLGKIKIKLKDGAAGTEWYVEN